MADRSAVAPPVPAQAAARHRHWCGCGLGLARLVGRLRRQAGTGRRARRRAGCQCQYDPLSYARNFDLGYGDDAAAHAYYGYSFSSRFVLAPSSSEAAAAAADYPRLTSVSV